MQRRKRWHMFSNGRIALLRLIGAALLGLGASGAAALGDPDLVSFTGGGVGVKGITGQQGGSDEINRDGSQTQALAVDFREEVVSVDATFSAFVASEQECGQWTAYDGQGTYVAEGLFGPTLTPTSIAPVEPFRILVFSARPYSVGSNCLSSDPDQGAGEDSSDYIVQSLTITYGDSSTATVTGTPSQWGSVVGLAGFDYGVPFEDNGKFVGPPIIVDNGECLDGNGQCNIQFTASFKTTIPNTEGIDGSIDVLDIATIADFREGCGFDGVDPGVKLPGAVDPIKEIISGPHAGGLNLGYVLTPSGVTAVKGPVIPPYICGFSSPGDTQGEFVLIALDADLDVSRTLIQHEVTDWLGDGNPNTEDDNFTCASGAQILQLPANQRNARRSRLPAILWAPYPALGEIPSVYGNGNLDPVFQDITFACGSARGGSRKLSFLLYQARHDADTTPDQYRLITGEEIDRLGVTVEQTRTCIDRLQYLALKARVALIQAAYKKRLYSIAKLELIGFLRVIQTSRLEAQLGQCFYDSTPFPGNVVTTSGDLARNFGGDIEGQLRHILYMMDRMLGVTSPAVPAGL